MTDQPPGLIPRRGLPRLRGGNKPSEPLGVLVLPGKLEEFELAAHARDLLDIDRVLALEPPRWRSGRMLSSDIVAMRQARRLRFPGKPRVVVLFHPRQFYLARALSAKHEAGLWYVTSPELEAEIARHGEEDLKLLDDRAREVASGVVVAQPGGNARADNQDLRRRLVELEIISSRPFVPGARVSAR